MPMKAPPVVERDVRDANWYIRTTRGRHAAAREMHGLERLDQVEYPVLEVSGGNTILPRE